jgi:hypothetical protein
MQTGTSTSFRPRTVNRLLHERRGGEHTQDDVAGVSKHKRRGEGSCRQRRVPGGPGGLASSGIGLQRSMVLQQRQAVTLCRWYLLGAPCAYTPAVPSTLLCRFCTCGMRSKGWDRAQVRAVLAAFALQALHHDWPCEAPALQARASGLSAVCWCH